MASAERIAYRNMVFAKLEDNNARNDITHLFVFLMGFGIIDSILLLQTSMTTEQRTALIISLMACFLGGMGCTIASMVVLVHRNQEKSEFIKTGHRIFHLLLLCIAFVPFVVVAKLL